MNSFQNKWLETVERKNTVLCAGLDPAEFAMGRGDLGLPEGVNKREWALRYVEAVARDAAAIKLNFQYFKAPGDIAFLHKIYKLAHSLDLLVIDDSKLADIGSTNDAGMFYGAQRADAITFSPFAGNIREAAQQARERGVGLIGMCLMSNPEYKREKNKLVNISSSDEVFQKVISYYAHHIIRIPEGDHINSPQIQHVKQYIYLARESSAQGLDGIVVGAPSPKNHITEEELENVRHYSNDNMLVLLPGVGKQGGEAGKIWGHFAPENVIVNVGRSLMFPEGSDSTSEDHLAAAKHYKDMLNELRVK